MASIVDSPNTKGGINHRSIKDGEVYGPKIHPDAASGAYAHYRGKGQPALSLVPTGVATGADATEHVAAVPGLLLHYWPIAAAAVLGPVAAADGLLLSLDQVAADGANYVPGGLFGPWRTTVDSLAPVPGRVGIFIRFRGKVSDVSGTADFAIGIRKAEAPQAAIDDYDELACLNIQSGNVFRETILNNAATVSVDTLFDWLDTEEHEVEVRCYTNGAVQFFFDRAKAPVGAAFTFDNAEVVVPFIYFLQAADLTDVNLTRLTVGYLTQEDLE
jgi:hypothetical protein